MNAMREAAVPAADATASGARPTRVARENRSAGGSLRLTRRGRLVAAAATAVLTAVAALMAAGAAQATSHSAPQRNLTQVVVSPGESLWSVAESADPDQDTRLVIQQIIDLNALNGDVIFVGQRLWVPRG